MKKILALVIAVAMLAMMAVPAAATPTTSQGEVRFIFGDIGQVPDAPGVFCPQADGPTPPGGWTGEFDFINNFASLGVDFGHRDMPTGTAAWSVAANTNDVRENVGLGTTDPRTRANRFLGIGVQAWIADHGPPVVLATGNWTLNASLTNFYEGGTWVNNVNTGGIHRMVDWRIGLSLPGGAYTTAQGPGVRPQQTFPAAAPNATLQAAPLLHSGGAQASIVASAVSNAIFVFEYLPTLTSPPGPTGVNPLNLPTPNVPTVAVFTWHWAPL